MDYFFLSLYFFGFSTVTVKALSKLVKRRYVPQCRNRYKIQLEEIFVKEGAF
jgi:hypothetical protein